MINSSKDYSSSLADLNSKLQSCSGIHDASDVADDLLCLVYAHKKICDFSAKSGDVVSILKKNRKFLSRNAEPYLSEEDSRTYALIKSFIYDPMPRKA